MEDFLRIILFVILYFLTLALTLGAFLVYHNITLLSDIEVVIASIIAGILTCILMAFIEEGEEYEEEDSV